MDADGRITQRDPKKLKKTSEDAIRWAQSKHYINSTLKSCFVNAFSSRIIFGFVKAISYRIFLNLSGQFGIYRFYFGIVNAGSYRILLGLSRHFRTEYFWLRQGSFVYNIFGFIKAVSYRIFLVSWWQFSYMWKLPLYMGGRWRQIITSII